MPMDLRVLTGVFVTLFGIAVGMAGGDIQEQDLMTAIQETDLSDGLSGLSALSELSATRQTKPANTSIVANLTSHETMTLTFRSPTTAAIQVSPGTRITVGDGTVQVQPVENTGPASIRLTGFTGTITTADNLSISGSARSIRTDHLSFNYSRQKTVEGADGLQAISLSRVQNQHVPFDAARGTITTGGTEIELSGEQADFRFFRGTLRMERSNGAFHYRMDGHVHHGELGGGDAQVTIGAR
jgi:hypothetical protein